jgi:hypothetical protein
MLAVFDDRDTAEIASPDYPGERLLCRNPALAAERMRKREDVLAASEKGSRQDPGSDDARPQPAPGRGHNCAQAIATPKVPSVNVSGTSVRSTGALPARLRAVVLVIAASLFAGCATERSDGAPCPPVVAYSQEFLARAAGELDSLPADSAIE